MTDQSKLKRILVLRIPAQGKISKAAGGGHDPAACEPQPRRRLISRGERYSPAPLRCLSNESLAIRPTVRGRSPVSTESSDPATTAPVSRPERRRLLRSRIGRSTDVIRNPKLASRSSELLRQSVAGGFPFTARRERGARRPPPADCHAMIARVRRSFGRLRGRDIRAPASRRERGRCQWRLSTALGL